MRKEIILPVVAVVCGGAGFALRRWELATAFEAGTGLPIPGAPAALALAGFSVLTAAVLALLCRGKYPAFSGYGPAFRAKGNTLYAMAGTLAAFLLLGGGALMLAGPVLGGGLVYTRLITGALAIAAGLCAAVTVRDNYRGTQVPKYSFRLLMPAYAFCVWLIAAYQVRAGDPVQLDYVYELFAIITGLLGLYFAAGFSFDKGRCVPTVFFSLLGVYFSLTTLADSHDWATLALYGFTILYLLASSALLLHNAARPLPQEPVENDTEGSSDV